MNTIKNEGPDFYGKFYTNGKRFNERVPCTLKSWKDMCRICPRYYWRDTRNSKEQGGVCEQYLLDNPQVLFDTEEEFRRSPYGR